jgi:hypothetical protein
MNYKIILIIGILTIIKIVKSNKDKIKVLVNKSYGGFLLSKKFMEEYKKLYGKEIKNDDIYNPYNDKNITKIETRFDKKLLNIYEILGKYESSGGNSLIEYEKIEKSMISKIKINEFYGFETVSYLEEIN